MVIVAVVYKNCQQMIVHYFRNVNVKQMLLY